jgi:hypothetical protein
VGNVLENALVLIRAMAPDAAGALAGLGRPGARGSVVD